MLGLDRTGGDNGNIEVSNHMIGARSEYQQRLSDGVTLRAGGDVLYESLAQKVTGQDSSVERSTASTPEPSDFGNPSGNVDNNGFLFDRSRHDFTAGTWIDSVLTLAPSRVRQAGRGVLQACAISASGASLGSCTANVIVSVGQDRVNLASGG